MADEATAAVRAANSYVRVPRVAMPLALADLHRAIGVGGLVQILAMAGDEAGHHAAGEDRRRRVFPSWERGALVDVVTGAGFDVVRVEEDKEDATLSGGRLIVEAIRARTLADTVGPGMRLLVVGLNPSLYAADAGVGFARPGNRFWPAMVAAGLSTRARDARHLLAVDRVGMTDLVKRATVSARELTVEEYGAGMARIGRLVEWLRPEAVCFLGVTGWRLAGAGSEVGWQHRRIGGRPTYVMPNPSGANAHARLDDLVAHLRVVGHGDPDRL